MHSKDKIVVYLATRNYYKYLLSAVTSLVTNTDVDAVYLLIEYCNEIVKSYYGNLEN